MKLTKSKLKEMIREELKNLQEAKTIKYKKNDWKKYNKLVKKGKSVMIQTAFGDEFSWEDGSNLGVWGLENNGSEVELSHDDIDKIVVY